MTFTIQQFDWFLRECVGAGDVGHSGRKLFDHLKGTYDLLRSWGASEDVCKAGLFHSIYGTNSFKHQCLQLTPTNRALLAELIGSRAERLAFIFCTFNRATFRAHSDHEPSQDRKDLLEIEAANLLEQGGNRKTLMQLVQHPGISENARAALRNALQIAAAERKQTG